MIPVINSVSLSSNVESLVSNYNLSYMDAVIHYCELANVEIEMAAQLIPNTSALYSKIELEAEGLNFLPKISRLPI